MKRWGPHFDFKKFKSDNSILQSFVNVLHPAPLQFLTVGGGVRHNRIGRRHHPIISQGRLQNLNHVGLIRYYHRTVYSILYT